MRILLIGATGTIGRAVAKALAQGNDVIAASRKGDVKVDISNQASIKQMFQAVGRVDAVVCATGNAVFKPLPHLTDEDFRFCLDNKLMGQVNVIREAVDCVSDGGSITVTSGVLAQNPMPGAAAISMVNAGLEGFVRGAALEAPRKIRVNVVSPPWVTETLQQLKMDTSIGMPAAEVAKAYVRSVTGTETGATIKP